MPILLALLIAAAMVSSFLLLLSIEDRNRPSLMDMWVQSRLDAPQPAKAPKLPYYYCERTKRYRDTETKRFIPRPV